MGRFFWGAIVCLAATQAFAQPSADPSLPKTPAPESGYTSSLPSNVPSAPGANGPCTPECAEERLNGLCGPPGRLWAEADFLLWFPRGDSLPPLVTASPAGTPRTAAGVLGQPNTTVLFGNQRVNDDIAPGFRVRVGTWIDCQQLWGIEGSFFFLGNDTAHFLANGSQFPVLSRPFFNVQTGAPDAELVAFPGTLAGTVTVNDHRNAFYGFDANARCNLCCGCNGRIDFLAGYRFLRLTETLTIHEALTTTDPAGAIPLGTGILVRDRFRTENTFNGGQIGLAGQYGWERFVVGFRGLAALGNIHRTADISGATAVSVPGQGTVTNAGGLLALPSNSGRFSSDRVGFASEVGLTLGYQLTDHVQLTVGYSFLCLTDVLRPGAQVELGVNPSQLPPGTLMGVRRPVFTPHASDFWAQGINFGLVARY
jgi:hypothetical protein